MVMGGLKRLAEYNRILAGAGGTANYTVWDHEPDFAGRYNQFRVGSPNLWSVAPRRAPRHIASTN
jgi:hypothetical protein